MPLLDHEGLRLLETSVLAPYLSDVLPGPSLVPATPRDRARMDMTIGLVDSDGEGALLRGVAAYHLLPDAVGGKNEEARRAGIENGRKLLDHAMRTRGAPPFIAGELSLADLPLTPTQDALFGGAGFAAWWDRAQAVRATARPSRGAARAARAAGADPKPIGAGRRAGIGSAREQRAEE